MAGDRPIEVTLQRAWYALSWGKRLRLAWSLATSRPQAEDLAQLQVRPGHLTYCHTSWASSAASTALLMSALVARGRTAAAKPQYCWSATACALSS